MIAAERLADAVTALAHRVAEPDVRAQLHALSALLRNLDVDDTPAPGDEAALLAAMAAGDEQQVVGLARDIAAAARAHVGRVDWSAASGG